MLVKSKCAPKSCAGSKGFKLAQLAHKRVVKMSSAFRHEIPDHEFDAWYNESADRPVHPRTLISPFVFCSLEIITHVTRLATCKIFSTLACLRSWVGWFMDDLCFFCNRLAYLSHDMWFPAMWHFDKRRLRRACAAFFFSLESPNDVPSVA